MPVYKLRAETIFDCTNVFKQLNLKKVEFKYMLTGNNLPDVELEITANLSLLELMSILDNVADGHVMYETVQPIESYTGERLGL